MGLWGAGNCSDSDAVLGLGIYLWLGGVGLWAEEGGRITLLCCVLMLFPEHLPLASSGARLLLIRGTCC